MILDKKNRFIYALGVAKRARQLQNGMPSLIQNSADNIISLAEKEIISQRIDINFVEHPNQNEEKGAKEEKERKVRKIGRRKKRK